MKTQNFKKEWNRSDFKTVNNAIKKHFSGKTFVNHRSEKIVIPFTFTGIENIFGLPYTSTSMYAMYSLDCNTNLYHPEFSDFHYSYVIMNEENEVFAVIQDKEENEILINLTK